MIAARVSPNVLWIAWAMITLAGFVALETWSLLDKTDRLMPLTHWLRLGVEHAGWLVVTILGGFVSWFAWHLLVEPLQRKTRRQKDR